MVNTKRAYKENSCRFLIQNIYSCIAWSLIFVLIFTASCVEKKMTIKEAKEVTVSVGGKLYEPPPRRMNAVLSILEQPRK